MKVGDRVKISSRNYTAGVRDEALDEQGTIVKKAPGDIVWFGNGESVWIVETDEDTCGHDARGVGKPGHCWNVDERDLEEVSVEERREDIEFQLFRRFKSIKGIGTVKARECTKAAMEYLDSLVEESSANGGAGAPTDFPWGKVPSEYKWAAWDYRADDSKELFVYENEPTLEVSNSSNSCWDLVTGGMRHVVHVCDVDGCNESDALLFDPSDIPKNFVPSSVKEAEGWLFQRPEE